MDQPWAPSPSPTPTPRARGGLLARTNEPTTNRVLSTFGPVLKAVTQVWTRQSWLGTDNIPLDGPAIIVPNHVSSLDPVLVGVFLAYNGRWPHFLAKESMFRAPVLGALMRAAEQIPVHRGSLAAKDSLVSARRVLDDGKVVVLYPEGTITLDPEEWPMAVHTGAARLGMTSGAPVIPVGQWGANFALPPRGIRPLRPGRWPVTLQAGPPVDLTGFGTDPRDRVAVRAASMAIADAITTQVELVRGIDAPADRWHPRSGRRVPRPEAVR